MRNTLLRAIFPDREAVTSNHQANVPVHSAGDDPRTLFSQTFSRLAPSLTGPLTGTVPGLTNSLGLPFAGSGGTEVFDSVAKNLDRLRTVTETQVTQTQANTAALSTNTAAKEASQVLSAASKASGGLLNGLTALPVISGLLQLFGGSSGGTQQQPLPKYVPPPTLIFDDRIQSGSDGAGIQNPSYDRYGNPRTASQSVPDYSPLIASARNTVGDTSERGSGTAFTGTGAPNAQAATGPPASSTNVTVNIQAMDSRSFLDRSQDIAQAVREAMLNMHSINDVVNDL